jgi:hypothetical protein
MYNNNDLDNNNNFKANQYMNSEEENNNFINKYNDLFKQYQF